MFLVSFVLRTHLHDFPKKNKFLSFFPEKRFFFAFSCEFAKQRYKFLLLIPKQRDYDDAAAEKKKHGILLTNPLIYPLRRL